jgi:hypothetical protein
VKRNSSGHISPPSEAKSDWHTHLLTQPGEEGPLDRADHPRTDTIHRGRSCCLIAPHPTPGDHQERRIGDEVEQVANTRLGSSLAHWCSLVWIFSTRCPAHHNSSAEIGSSMFTIVA